MDSKILGFLSVSHQLQDRKVHLKDFLVTDKSSFAEFSLAVPTVTLEVALVYGCILCAETVGNSSWAPEDLISISTTRAESPSTSCYEHSANLGVFFFLVCPKPASCSCFKIKHKALPWL